MVETPLTIEVKLQVIRVEALPEREATAVLEETIHQGLLRGPSADGGYLHEMISDSKTTGSPAWKDAVAYALAALRKLDVELCRPVNPS